MIVRIATLLVAGLTLAAGLPADAESVTPGSPNLARIAVAPKDVGGEARVLRQGSLRAPGYLSAFERELQFDDGRVGSSLLFFLTSTVELARASVTPREELAATRQSLATPAGRKVVLDAMMKKLRESLGASLKTATMGTLRTPAIGNGSLVVPISVTTTTGRLQVVVAYLRVDRLLVTLSIVGAPVGRADVDRLLRLVARRASAELSPVALGPPAISGVAQAGQVLIASSGSWANSPTGYSYRWSRCDAGGRACTTIPRAEQPSYTATAVDVGTTLRVTVVARNAAGTTRAVSPPTALVTPAA